MTRKKKIAVLGAALSLSMSLASDGRTKSKSSSVRKSKIKPKTPADHAALERAQAKRERKAAKRRDHAKNYGG